MDEAVHTSAVVLSAAALADFCREVDRRMHDGEMDRARRLWQSAVQVVHRPWYLSSMRPVGLGRLRVAPCMDERCSRCIQERGGFQFPFIGTWTRRSCLPLSGCDPAEAWRTAKSEHARLEPFQVEAFASGIPAAMLSPEAIQQLLDKTTGATGVATFREVFQAWYSFQRGTPLWQDPGLWVLSREAGLRDSRARAQRSLALWLSDLERTEGPVPAGCVFCGTPTYMCCHSCRGGWCWPCRNEATSCVCCTMSLEDVGWVDIRAAPPPDADGDFVGFDGYGPQLQPPAMHGSTTRSST